MNTALHRRIAQDIRFLLIEESRILPAQATEGFIHLLMASASRAWRMPVEAWTAWEGLQPAFPELYPAGLREQALSLLGEIPEEDWRLDPRLPGWMYQYWLASQKAQLFRRFKTGTKAAHRDIPAVTQLFTPEWIARYLAENTVGRLWETACPGTSLLHKWQYYDAPHERKDAGQPADPLEWTVLDPACGCGHLLTAAFDILLDICEEAGIAKETAVISILSRQLYGLDIDPAAVRICRFVLLLKGAAVAPQILLEAFPLHVAALTRESGFCFGSLDRPAPQAPAAAQAGAAPALEPAALLSKQYHVVITNPPYLGRRNMDKETADFLDRAYPGASGDLFAAFMVRCLELLLPHGYHGAITPQSWMFLSNYEGLRTRLLDRETVISLLHLGSRAFEGNSGEVVQTVSFILRHAEPSASASGRYWRLTEGTSRQKEQAFISGNPQRLHQVGQSIFRHIPGTRLAYELPVEWASLFRLHPPVSRFCTVKKGMDTGCNEQYVRLWHEVPRETLSFCSPAPETASWYPYAKGGGPQKWYGNHYYVVFWQNNGEAIRRDARSNLRNCAYFGRPGITWSTVSTGRPGFRLLEEGFLFDNGGSCLFPVPGQEETIPALLAYLNSGVAATLLSQMNPTLNVQPGDVARLPLDMQLLHHPRLAELGRVCIELARAEWNETERSWSYIGHPAVHTCRMDTAELSLRHYAELRVQRLNKLRELERSADLFILDYYGLGRPSGGKEKTELTREEGCLKEAAEALLSYAIGCFLGVYGGPDSDKGDQAPDILWESDFLHMLHGWLSRIWRQEESGESIRAIARFLGLKARETGEERILRYFQRDWYPRHCREFDGRPRYLRISSGSRQALVAYAPVLGLHDGTADKVRAMAEQRKDDLLAKLGFAKTLADGGPADEGAETEELLLDVAELEAFSSRLRAFDPKVDGCQPARDGTLSLNHEDARMLAERYGPLFDC